jgi:carbamoyl-phosphate synthase small subunit
MSRWECALYLENGHLFVGEGLGARTSRGGEAVFNTGMSGYQEIFTDPSYCQQLVVMTYPHIGNTGVNAVDPESATLDLSGVVLRDYCPTPSSWRSELPLGEYLSRVGVPGIADVDTREITQFLRDEGAQRGILFPIADAKCDALAHGKSLMQAVPAMEGLELVSRVSCKTPYVFDGSAEGTAGTVVVYDYGVKTNTLRHLRDRKFRVQVVPYNLPHQEVLAYKPKALLLSNGPGDPATVPHAVNELQGLVGKVPIMAICMGHQLLARAMGAKTYKLKFGHHGINHPVKDLLTGRILITSQNHGFAVKVEDLKSRDLTLSHINLNDQTVEGFVSDKMKFYSVQFHPESKPGPSDAAYLFDNFIKGFVQ